MDDVLVDETQEEGAWACWYRTVPEPSHEGSNSKRAGFRHPVKPGSCNFGPWMALPCTHPLKSQFESKLSRHRLTF